jgi:hypothetical protein
MNQKQFLDVKVVLHHIFKGLPPLVLFSFSFFYEEKTISQVHIFVLPFYICRAESRAEEVVEAYF